MVRVKDVVISIPLENLVSGSVAIGSVFVSVCQDPNTTLFKAKVRLATGRIAWLREPRRVTHIARDDGGIKRACGVGVIRGHQARQGVAFPRLTADGWDTPNGRYARRYFLFDADTWADKIAFGLLPLYPRWPQ